MAIVNSNISPLLSEGSNITLTSSGQVTTISTGTFSTAIDLTSGQIKFPASQNASADINTLDDYSETTWTPSLSASGSTFNYAANGRIGHYTKVGRLVAIQFRIQLATTGNTLTANTMTITGLPYTSGSGTNRAFYSSLYFSAAATSMVSAWIEIPASSSTINLFRLTAAGTSPGAMVANNLSTTAGSVLGGTITYFV